MLYDSICLVTYNFACIGKFRSLSSAASILPNPYYIFVVVEDLKYNLQNYNIKLLKSQTERIYFKALCFDSKNMIVGL